MMEREDELYKLRGKTLQVYIYMLRAGRPVGVRELQRALGFSSPSVAHHHLEKLREMGLVLRDEGNRYLVQEKVDVGILKMFVLVGGRLIPRMVFYAVFITTLLVLYVAQSFPNLSLHAISLGGFSSLFFWIETIRIWRHRAW
ncbi:MAG: ArsR family transcriptional regulator [Thaumarchaeota archaeon]|nr:ArsR family transcriptional regulator [Nitrososphaerota archaeon]MCL7386880.1 ArsR family transcriptional regulator [Candidatus Wolframiiraptor allenii]